MQALSCHPSLPPWLSQAPHDPLPWPEQNTAGWGPPELVDHQGRKRVTGEWGGDAHSTHLFLHATGESEQETRTDKQTFTIWGSKGSTEGRTLEAPFTSLSLSVCICPVGLTMPRYRVVA